MTNLPTQQVALAKIAELKEQAEALLKEAKSIADQHEIPFHLTITDESDDWESSWSSSSANC